mmetsp:Transcript_42386/g.111653  ORF Transcript_42386/g.111653 Transcript_42386/m.111653 type:complete len:325 (-) Transcript_42386:406-1380(-)
MVVRATGTSGTGWPSSASTIKAVAAGAGAPRRAARRQEGQSWGDGHCCFGQLGSPSWYISSNCRTRSFTWLCAFHIQSMASLLSEISPASKGMVAKWARQSSQSKKDSNVVRIPLRTSGPFPAGALANIMWNNVQSPHVNPRFPGQVPLHWAVNPTAKSFQDCRLHSTQFGSSSGVAGTALKKSCFSCLSNSQALSRQVTLDAGRAWHAVPTNVIRACLSSGGPCRKLRLEKILRSSSAMASNASHESALTTFLCSLALCAPNWASRRSVSMALNWSTSGNFTSTPVFFLSQSAIPKIPSPRSKTVVACVAHWLFFPATKVGYD